MRSRLRLTSAAGVRISDLGCKEFEEAMGGARAGGRDDGGAWGRDGVAELIHGAASLTFRRSSASNTNSKSSSTRFVTPNEKGGEPADCG